MNKKYRKVLTEKDFKEKPFIFLEYLWEWLEKRFQNQVKVEATISVDGVEHPFDKENEAQNFISSLEENNETIEEIIVSGYTPGASRMIQVYLESRFGNDVSIVIHAEDSEKVSSQDWFLATRSEGESLLKRLRTMSFNKINNKDDILSGANREYGVQNIFHGSIGQVNQGENISATSVVSKNNPFKGKKWFWDFLVPIIIGLVVIYLAYKFGWQGKNP